jgi:hypothetical protein
MKNEANPKESAGTARRERLWQLYKIAFQRLVDRHISVPPHLYTEVADREWESARDIAHHALTLALAAAHEFQSYEERVAEFESEKVA